MPSSLRADNWTKLTAVWEFIAVSFSFAFWLIALIDSFNIDLFKAEDTIRVPSLTAISLFACWIGSGAAYCHYHVNKNHQISNAAYADLDENIVVLTNKQKVLLTANFIGFAEERAAMISLPVISVFSENKKKAATGTLFAVSTTAFLMACLASVADYRLCRENLKNTISQADGADENNSHHAADNWTRVAFAVDLASSFFGNAYWIANFIDTAWSVKDSILPLIAIIDFTLPALLSGAALGLFIAAGMAYANFVLRRQFQTNNLSIVTIGEAEGCSRINFPTVMTFISSTLSYAVPLSLIASLFLKLFTIEESRRSAINIGLQTACTLFGAIGAVAEARTVSVALERQNIA